MDILKFLLGSLLGVRALKRTFFSSALEKNYLGQKGEQATDKALKRILPDNHIILNNVLIPAGRYSTAQIDHIVVGPSGVWVIETKNWHTRIYGHRNARHWKSYAGNWEETMLNPIHQARRHAITLSRITGTWVTHVVAMAGDAELNLTLAPEDVLAPPETIARHIRDAPVQSRMTSGFIQATANAIQVAALENIDENHAAHVRRAA